MTEVYINVIEREGQVLVAACDVDLLGKKLIDGNLTFEVRPSFYGGSKVRLEEAIELIKKSTIANLVGSNIVSQALKEGVVHPQGILQISGTPHAQIVKI